jgi:hypothetical protein
MGNSAAVSRYRFIFWVNIMAFWFFLIIVIFIGIAIGTINAKHMRESKQEVEIAIANLSDFSADFKYSGANGENGIALDQERAKVCLFKRTNGVLTHKVIPCRDLLSTEIFEDGYAVTKTVRSSQIGGALVGGVLLGGAGAIIGGLSGKRIESGKVKTINLRVVINDPAHPIYTICFLDIEIERGNFLHTTMVELAKQWQARLDIFIKLADKEDLLSVVSTSRVSSSLSEELLKLSDLKTRGILTQAEFDSQKAKLLG